MSMIIKIDTEYARDKTQQAKQDVAALEDSADSASASMAKLGAAGAQAGQQVAAGMKNAGDQVGATGETFSSFFDRIGAEQARVLARIKGPWEDYQADLRATNALMNDGRISMTEYEAESARLGARLAALHENNLTPQLKLEADMLEAIVGPLRRYEQELEALQALLRAEQITLDQYDASLAKVQRRAEVSGAIAPVQGPTFSSDRGMSAELKLQEDLLRRIQAPMKEYEAQIRALDELLKRGAIDEETFNREMERAAKNAGRGLGPVQGPTQASGTPQAAGGNHDAGRGAELIDAVAPKFGAVGDIFGGLATKGTIATAAVVALGVELVHLGDEYIVLSNKARKVTDVGYSIDETLQQQLALSKELHGSLAATIELYDAVRDGTDELNLSQRQQVNLAREIGQAVLAEGKSIESAEGLMKRLTYAFASGAITGRDMKSIMREFPDIGAAFVTTMGHSRNELVAMANKGQISAEMLIDSFRKMNKEMADKVDKQVETSSQHWQHFKDTLLIDIPHAAGVAVDAIDRAARESALANASNETGVDVDEIHRQEEALRLREQTARVMRVQAEAARLLTGEQERNAKTAGLASVAGKLGIEFGDFSEGSANAIAALRIQLGQLGIDTGDAFEKAHGRASLFGRKLEEIQERKDAEKIAEDVKRIYDALHGVDDLLEDQQKHWTKLSDDVTRLSGAISMLQAKRLVSGAPQSQDERDLELQLANAKTEQANAQYGKSMVSYAQGINNAKAELEAFNRAQKDGEIKGEAARQKYESIITTLNDGRLPEAIKIWDSIHLPIEQAARDFAAVNALLRSGRIDVSDYTVELEKIVKTGKSGEAALLNDGIARLNQRLSEGQITLRGYDEGVQKLVQSFNTLHRTASGIQFRIAPEGPSGPSGLLPRTEQPLALPSVTNSDEMRKIMAQYQSTTGIFGGTSDEAKQLNAQFERANELATEFVAPSVKYEERLKDIGLALNLNSITEDQATAARRRAKDTFNQETEALEAQKGPLEAYNAALVRLKNQYADHNISAKQLADGIDKAKEAMLQATGAADTFAGAMQLEWIKLQSEAEKYGATLANMAVNDVGKFNDAIVTAANGGAVSWTAMADSMIQDLERVLLKMLEIQAIKGIGGLFDNGGGGSSGGGDAVGAATAALSSLGFANGGSFIVGGDGGVDTTPVGFRATRGERVTITPPGAYPHAVIGNGGGGGGYGPMPVIQNHIHNHYDTAVSQAALDGPGGQRSVMNTLRVSQGELRRLTTRTRRA